MTEEEKRQIIRYASDVWLVWHWVNKTKENFAARLSDPENPGTETDIDVWGVRKLLSAASKKIEKIIRGEAASLKDEISCAMESSARMRTVCAWLDECMDGATAVLIKKSDAEGLLGVAPGRYRLADIKRAGHLAADGLNDWVAVRSLDAKRGRVSVCPFCGGPAEVRRACGRYGVQCTRSETCGAVAYFDSESESSVKTVGAWLKRRPMRSIETENPMEGPFFNPCPGAYPQTLKRIRPCPFCGGRVLLAGLDSGDGPSGAIRCGTCRVTIMFRSADGPENICDIVDRWNRREGEDI